MFKWHIYFEWKEKTVLADYVVIHEQTGQKLFYSNYGKKKTLIAVAPVSSLVIKAQ